MTTKHWLTLLAAAVALACSSDETIVNPPAEPVPVAVVELVAPPAQLTVGDDAQFTAVTKDAAGRPLHGRTVSWESADANVATVSQSGRVIALAEGWTYISASSEGRVGRSLLRVVPRVVPVATVTIAQGPALTADVGTYTLLRAEARATDGSLLTGRPVAWSSNRPAVASVSEIGLLEAVSLGEATITATVEGKSASIAVSVTSYVAWIEMDPPAMTMVAGEVKAIQALARTPQGQVLNTPIAWTSSDPTVANVVAPGRVQGLKPGIVRITASAQGKTGTTVVEVTTAASYGLATVNGAPPPVVLFTTTERDANNVERTVRYEVISGSLRIVFGSDRYEQSFFFRIHREGQPMTGGQFVTIGATWYNFITGAMHFLPDDGSPEFVSEPGPLGALVIRQRYKAGAPEAVLRYLTP